MKWRMILLATLIGITPTVGAMIYLRFVVEKIGNESTIEKTTDILSDGREVISEFLSERVNTVSLWSELGFLKLAMEFKRSEDLSKYFNRLTKDSTYYKDISILDEKEGFFFSSSRARDLSDLGKKILRLKKIIKEHRSKKQMFQSGGLEGLIFEDNNPDQPVIIKRIYGESNRLLGFLIVSISGGSLSKINSKIQLRVKNLERVKSFGSIYLSFQHGTLCSKGASNLSAQLPRVCINGIQYNPYFDTFRSTVLFLFVFFLFASFYFVFFNWLFRKLLRPIGLLLQGFEEFSLGKKVTISFRSKEKELKTLEDNANRLISSISVLREREHDSIQAIAFNKVASQVAHDIRSPLSALEMISSQLSELPEEKRVIIRNSIHRIRDIANSLIGRKKDRIIQMGSSTISSRASTAIIVGDSINLETALLSSVMDSIVTEKRIQYRDRLGVEIVFDQTRASYGLFAKINITEFKRAISNLVDNAVEAFVKRGKVEIILRPEVDTRQVIIEIADNGKGMPQGLLDKVGVRGITVGKIGGSGLGLAHAKETFKQFKGDLAVRSKEGIGTTITLNLPLEEPPHWFVPKLEIKENQKVIIFDDDQTIHQIWKGRFESVAGGRAKVDLEHFSTMDSFRNFFRNNFFELEDRLFLMDYEILGSKETGLDLIFEMGLAKQSILVTSRYEEPAIRDRCERVGVRLIPKPMSGFVPIEMVEN